MGGLRQTIRNAAFRWSRREIAALLEDHEEEILRIVRDELQRADDEVPDEASFVDIRMAALGEAFTRAGLRAARRVLAEVG